MAAGVDSCVTDWDKSAALIYYEQLGFSIRKMAFHFSLSVCPQIHLRIRLGIQWRVLKVQITLCQRIQQTALTHIHRLIVTSAHLPRHKMTKSDYEKSTTDTDRWSENELIQLTREQKKKIECERDDNLSGRCLLRTISCFSCNCHHCSALTSTNGRRRPEC